MFVNTFWALVPPIVAIVLALITKETFSSLFVGILVGALLLTGFDPVETVTTIISGEFGEGEDAVTTGLIPAVADNAGIFIFLVMLGIMVALVNITGAASAFGKWAARNVKSRVGANLATFILGVLIFIDDYFNVYAARHRCAEGLTRETCLFDRCDRCSHLHDRTCFFVGRRCFRRCAKPAER